MTPGRVSVIIPARNERFLQLTINSLLDNACGDVEILACLDGYWPDPPLREDPRVRQLHFGTPRGMRPCENAAAEIATGEFLLKIDAHCIVGPGWDEALKASCGPSDLVVPTRHSIDGEVWLRDGEARDPGAEFPRAIKPRYFNYHVLTFPFIAATMYGEGLHAVTFDWKKNREINEQRRDMLIDDLMSFQGSCWFQRRADFMRLGPLDHEHYYFYQEAQEVGLRVWMTGGRCLINRTTYYAHMHKGNNALHTEDGRVGRGFYLSLARKRESERFAADFWLNDRWPGATRTFVQFIEHFWPLLSQMTDPRYAWPADWHDLEKHRQAFEARTPDEIPAHL